MLSKISLKFGAHPAAAPLEFSPGPITVIVGPNYAGKSRLIREIHHAASHGYTDPDALILDNLDLVPIPVGEINDAITQVTLTPNPGETVPVDHIVVGRLHQRRHVPLTQLKEALANFHIGAAGPHFRHWASQWFFSAKTRLLDGQSRIGLTNDQPFGDLTESAQTTFQQLFRDDGLRGSIRRIVHEAFGLYLVTDPTQTGQIRLRLSNRAPDDLEEEQALTQRAARFHRSATLLSQASDGTRAFCGILIEVMAGNPDLLLLDEPEAFLHPGLSFKLGMEMARQVQGRNKNIVVATHSPDFLMGCVSSGVPVNVLRLTFKSGTATARMLPAEDITGLMRNPLLRSANVLSALFYDNVVLTEGDTDRAFYQEINNRLLKEGRGIQNALFVNANGKDAIPVMMAPLRRLGVSVSAIYDIDFVKDGGTPGRRRLTAANIPEALVASLGTARSSIKAALEAANPQYKREGGAGVLSSSDRSAYDAYADQLARFGLHLVYRGEVEGWLKEYDIGGHAAQWLIPMFERLGDEGTNGYVTPSNADVWTFVDSLNSWLRDPNRAGLD